MRVTLLVLALTTGLAIAAPASADIANDLRSGATSASAIKAAAENGSLSAKSVAAAMDAHPKKASSLFLAASEISPALTAGLIQATSANHSNAIIDAVLLAVINKSPGLEAMATTLAKTDIELALQALSAVTIVVGNDAKELLGIMKKAAPKNAAAMEDVFQRALATKEGNGTTGDFEEADYEIVPGDSASPK